MDPAAVLPSPAVVDTDPASSFACEYVPGVNRVLSLPPYLLVDNIARNVELWRLAADARRVLDRTRYDDTSYPGDPDASLLDLDIHAAFLRDGRDLVTVNHYGRVRAFPVPASSPRMFPSWEAQLLGDMERVVLVDGCLVASSPRGEFTPDAARPGVFVFEPLADAGATREQPAEPRRLQFDQILADWGFVRAVAVSRPGDRLVVSAGPRVGVFPVERHPAGLRVGACLWECELPFDAHWLHVDEDRRLWTGGPGRTGARPGDASTGPGGGVRRHDLENGSVLAGAPLPDATAWGFGADPLVLAPGGDTLHALGHDASLHAVDVAGGAVRQTYRAPDSLGGAAPASFGIGHAARCGRCLYAGFSRGGFWLLRYDLRD